MDNSCPKSVRKPSQTVSSEPGEYEVQFGMVFLYPQSQLYKQYSLTLSRANVLYRGAVRAVRHCEGLNNPVKVMVTSDTDPDLR